MPHLNPAPKSRHEFFTALAESELLSVHQFARADGVVPESVQPAREAAQLLVTAKVLTRFQADRLLAGRTDGFVLGQHVIQEQVGQGSQSRVYRAIHRAMNRTVAIKVMNTEMTRSDEARRAYQREVRAAARLNHLNIVTAYDANEIGDRFYLVLEFVDGPTLDALVRAQGPLPVREACELIRQTALGLQHAHENGMVHRDIKPTNLLVTRVSNTMPGCTVKIADFGIARLAPVLSTVPPAGTGLLGTPDYVSPEQAFNPRLADHRSDLYSLGCVLYFLLSGRPPFAEGSTQEKIHRHQCEYPVPIQMLRPEVAPALADLVSRLLAKDPNLRPQAAAEVAADLHMLLSGAEGRIDFNLPPMDSGQPSFAGGSSASAETSPWDQLTDETFDSELTKHAFPEETPPSEPATHQRKPVRRGLPGYVVLGLCLVLAAGCVMALSLLLKLVGR